MSVCRSSLPNDTLKEKLCFTQFSIRITTWLLLAAICKSRYWNLGIGIGSGNGIGIRTDITNAIISSSMRAMDPKLSRMVT